jgi:hypothetical protein
MIGFNPLIPTFSRREKELFELLEIPPNLMAMPSWANWIPYLNPKCARRFLYRPDNTRMKRLLGQRG